MRVNVSMEVDIFERKEGKSRPAVSGSSNQGDYRKDVLGHSKDGGWSLFTLKDCIQSTLLLLKKRNQSSH